MTLRILLVALFFLGGLVAEEATARSKRVSQIPNGAAFSCNACHTAGGGSPRNAFGLELETNFLTAAGAAGDVIWGPELAALDSDGDGVSNGAELGDPDGTWVVGDPDPEGGENGEEEDHGDGDDDDGEEEDHGEHGHEGDSSLAGKVFNPGDPTSTPPPASHDTAVEVSTWAQIKHLVGALD